MSIQNSKQSNLAINLRSTIYYNRVNDNVIKVSVMHITGNIITDNKNSRKYHGQKFQIRLL